MPVYEYLAIGFMLIFILSLFTGYPVAWLLGGLSLAVAAGGILLSSQFGVDTFLMSSWAKFSGIIDRFDGIIACAKAKSAGQRGRECAARPVRRRQRLAPGHYRRGRPGHGPRRQVHRLPHLVAQQAHYRTDRAGLPASIED